ncbi:S phase cyclin A-associated protein in the endoplasmic reticulum [Hyalella azteca]|uniref:S phase cyclin A-associated protein in the endoplasmic reticulum n=1 Tax=Hyalella azteca TaxID=294128 RepID=A0A979FKD8_HYAAZ|nr:S phase cyclin A-associated protein in the endoplasmic reticulum [Hyalella azteca]
MPLSGVKIPTSCEMEGSRDDVVKKRLVKENSDEVKRKNKDASGESKGKNKVTRAKSFTNNRSAGCKFSSAEDINCRNGKTRQSNARNRNYSQRNGFCKENISSSTEGSKVLTSLSSKKLDIKEGSDVNKSIKSNDKSSLTPSISSSTTDVRRSKSFVLNPLHDGKSEEKGKKKSKSSGSLEGQKLGTEQAKPNDISRRRKYLTEETTTNAALETRSSVRDDSSTLLKEMNKKIARDPKDFFSRGKASSDAFMEYQSKYKKSGKDGTNKHSTAARENKSLKAEKYGKDGTDQQSKVTRENKLLKEENEEMKGTCSSLSSYQTEANGSNSLTEDTEIIQGGVSYRYGEVMARLHEEIIEAAAVGGGSSADAPSSFYASQSMELLAEKLEVTATSDAVEEDAEDAAADADLRDNAAAIESAVAEEQRLKQQIHDTENTDCTATVSGDNSSESGSEPCSLTTSGQLNYNGTEQGQGVADQSRREGNRHRDESTDTEDDDELEMDSKAILEIFASLDWSEENVESCRGVLESSGVREPGRVLQIHEKLSSPSRKLPLAEKLRRHNERLAKAEMLRQTFIDSKTEKLKELFKRIEEVSMDKERLLEEKRHLLERKMDRAEEKRRQHLQDIVAKAHDEDNKGREIAFINGLEAQNKLHDLLQQHQSHSSRLADIAEERSRRQEEKAAKEMAAQERRRALEAERQARLLELCEKRRERCERIDRQQAERREELLEQAREKARDRQERLTALLLAQQAKEDELVKRILLKQQESARRHEENIEQIKRRALESSILRCSTGCDDAPKICRYERQKLCTLCQCLLSSEVYLLSHLRGARHQEALRELHDGQHVSTEDTATCNLKHIIDAPDNIEDPQVTRDKERQKTLKKRCRKIRARMAARGQNYDGPLKSSTLPSSANSKRISKALFAITKLQTNQGSGPWAAAEVAALDKNLLELLRILDKKCTGDKEAFCALGGFGKIIEFLSSLKSGEDSSLDSSDEIEASEVQENNKENCREKAKHSKGSDSTNSNRKKKKLNSSDRTKSSSTNTKSVSNKNKQRSSHNLEDDDDIDSILSMSLSQELNSMTPNILSTKPTPCVVPEKSLGLCSRVLLQAVAGHPGNSRHLVYSNQIVALLDWLMHRLQSLQQRAHEAPASVAGGASVIMSLPTDPAVVHTLEVLAEVLTVVSESDLNNNSPGEDSSKGTPSGGSSSGGTSSRGTSQRALVRSSSGSSAGENQAKETQDFAWFRLQDVVSYCVAVGVADRVSWYLGHVQGPGDIEADPAVSQLILAAMQLLSALVSTLLKGLGSNYKGDPTHLLGTLKVTDACGVVSLLYGLLLHDGGRSAYLSTSSNSNATTGTLSPSPNTITLTSPSTNVTPVPSSLTTSTSSSLPFTPVTTPSPVHQFKQPSFKSDWSAEISSNNVVESSSCSLQPAKLQPDIEKITLAATTLLRNLAVLDLGVFQGVLGSEGISLELRHVASFLLWHSSYWPSEDILNNVIALVGFLTVNNPDNQCVVQSGETPTVLQQLCALPWQYFSEPRLTTVLFPTLLACCAGNPHNAAILHSEMSAQVLLDYVQNEGKACTNPLMGLLLQNEGSLLLVPAATERG